MYDFYLTNNGNILNTDLWCFQTPDGRFLRPVLHEELTYLIDVLIPVEFPEGLEIPDISNLDEFALYKGEFESIFEWMNKSSIYEDLTDSDLVFKRSNYKDLLSFVNESNPKDFAIGVNGNIYINLKDFFFYLCDGHVFTLHDPFMHFENVEFNIPKEKTKRRSKHSS